MKRHTKIPVVALLAAISCACQSHAQEIQTYFSPNGGTAAAITREITNAHKSIDIAAYELTNTAISNALIAATARGVLCRIVIDPKADNPKAKTLRALKAAGIPIRPDHREKIQHNKYAIIDGTRLITGSYNWSNDAEHRNAENTLILNDPTTIKAFEADFATHWDHSTPGYSETRPTDQRTPPRAQPSPTSPSPHNKEP